MKTYLMHVINGDEQFDITFRSNKTWTAACYVFSSVCSGNIFGFGDAKATKLYRAMEEVEKCGKSSMKFSHQGHKVQINLEVQ